MGNDHFHMMDFEFPLNMWIFILIGVVIFFGFLIILLYILRSTPNSKENGQLKEVEFKEDIVDTQSIKTLEKKRYCLACGNEINDRKTIYCPYCGNKV
jgi:heme/copper-type cytochrome/quinol oxidase subunit 3